MNRHSIPVRRRLLVSALLLSAAPMLVPAGLNAAPVVPEFSPANFTPGAAIDNPYFPLVPGTIFRESAQVTDPDTGLSRFEEDVNTVSFSTVTIGGVPARAVHAQVFFDGVLGEDTQDYYAQDKSGNVWYLGEDTAEFTRDAQGNIIDTDTTGTWRAGRHGDLPGFIMPANPTIGFSYVQEHAPADNAEDQAQIASLTETASVPFGDFTNVLKTIETSPLEPDVVEAKFYARGVGEILIWENIDDAGQPLNRIPLVSVSVTSIPLPPGAWAGGATIALIGAAGCACRMRRLTRA